MKNLDDISLVTQVAVFHNRRAFDRLVVKYQSPIRRFFLNQTLGDEQLSEDLAQDTFVKAYVNIVTFKGVSAFSTWLYRIAYNVLYDHVRHSRPSEDIDTSVAARRNASRADSALRMDLYEALRRLNDKERLCITLQMVDGHRIEKISEITGMAAGTVKSHIFRGKEKLSKFLKQNGYDR